MKYMILCVFTTLLMAYGTQQTPSPTNIVPLMGNGMENEAVRQVLAEEIRDVMTITNSRFIDVLYYKYDLNSNGRLDIITYIQSPLHCGSRGCSFWIWINDGSGEYMHSGSLTVNLLTFEGEVHPKVRVAISAHKTNGFFDIEISGPYVSGVLRYYMGRYLWLPI